MTEHEWNRQAASMLMNGASMLLIEAEEWRKKRAPDEYGRDREKMNRIADAIEGMAKHMKDHVALLKQIA